MVKWSFRDRQKLSTAAMGGLLLALAAVTVAVGAGIGSRLNWWPFGTGFMLLRWAVYAAIAAAIVSALGLFASRPGGNKRGLLRSLLGLAISLPVIILPLLWINTAGSVPPIHDISTDTQNPPQFDAISALRADAPNSTEYGGPQGAAQQHEAYPDIQPVDVSVAPKTAFNTALQAGRQLGWAIIAQDPQTGRIEATDSTFWFGFKDDVVIRITAHDNGSRVDIRSVSRVGRSDVGTNAARIRAFLREFQKDIHRQVK